MSYVIEHKHTVGDEIYFMYKNKVMEGKVDAIKIYVNKGNYPKITETKIIYSISLKHPTLQINEEVEMSEVDVFDTKKDLLDSL